VSLAGVRVRLDNGKKATYASAARISWLRPLLFIVRARPRNGVSYTSATKPARHPLNAHAIALPDIVVSVTRGRPSCADWVTAIRNSSLRLRADAKRLRLNLPRGEVGWTADQGAQRVLLCCAEKKHGPRVAWDADGQKWAAVDFKRGRAYHRHPEAAPAALDLAASAHLAISGAHERGWR
jgi:hypothetical protein